MYWPHTDKSRNKVSSKIDFSRSFYLSTLLYPRKHSVNLIFVLSDRVSAETQASHQLTSKVNRQFWRLAQEEGRIFLDWPALSHLPLPKPPGRRTVGLSTGHSGPPCCWDLMLAFVQDSAADGKETEDPGRRKRRPRVDRRPTAS